MSWWSVAALVESVEQRERERCGRAEREVVVEQREASGLSTCVKTARSQIHPDYANRFIREFILEDV